MSQPRLILFGPAGAGKSALLGALAQAASSAPPALKGTLVEKSGQLEQLQRSTYQGKLPSTSELEAYDIRLDGDSAAAATLLDCSGTQAGELLKAEQPFAEPHPMQRPILDADAVLLIVNAAQPSKQLNEQFQQFGNWLNQFHETRGRRVDVGTLPVYLVLTHCDQLAKADDTFTMWMQRIEEGKRKIHERFRKYIKDQGTGFGSLDLRIWATSIKRPQLSDRPAKSAEPYGVAELFRESLDAAADFQHRRYTSARRLQNITVGLTGALTMLLLTVTFLLAYQPDKSGAILDDKAQRVLPKSDKPAVRIGGSMKKLDEKRKALADIRKDPAWSRLPKQSQEAVMKYGQEIEDYFQLKEDSEAVVKLPMHALKSEKDFEDQEKLVTAFKLKEDWDQTPLGKYVRECQKQYDLVRKEEKKEVDWLTAQKKLAEGLSDEGIPLLKVADAKQAEAWYKKYLELRVVRRQSSTEMIPGVTGVTYELLGRFKKVQDARKTWDSYRIETFDNMAKLIRAKIPAD